MANEKISDFIRETTTTSGTGTINLDGAKTGYQAFSAKIATGNTVYYGIKDGNNWEVGVGTLTVGSPDTLSRDTIKDSSNSGNKINLSGGAADVYCTMIASQHAYIDEGLNLISQAGANINLNVGTGTFNVSGGTLTLADDQISGDKVLITENNTYTSIPAVSTGGGATVAVEDFGKLLRFSTADQTIALPAAATAGAGFWVDVANTSSANIMTVDADGTEKIGGPGGLLETLPVFSGGKVKLICDGTQWFWEGDLGLKPFVDVTISGNILNVTGNNTIYTVAYDTETADPYGLFDAVTNYDFTCPLTGYYDISLMLAMDTDNSIGNVDEIDIDFRNTTDATNVFQQYTGDLFETGSASYVCILKFSSTEKLTATKAYTNRLKINGLAGDTADINDARMYIEYKKP